MAHDAIRTWILVALRAATEPVKEEAMQAMIVVMSFGVCVAKLRVLEWRERCGEPAFYSLDANQAQNLPFRPVRAQQLILFNGNLFEKPMKSSRTGFHRRKQTFDEDLADPFGGCRAPIGPQSENQELSQFPA